MTKSGIYVIKHKESGKVYVGSAVNINGRFASHKHWLRRRKHSNKYLQNAWTKYKEDAFEFSVLELVADKINLIIREQYWLDYYKSYNREFGYNIRHKADANYGVSPSEATRKKIGDGNRGKFVSKETCRKISKANTGYKHSIETRLKLSKSLTGRKLSSSTIEKMKGRIPWNKGIPARESTKLIWSKQRKGRKAWNSGTSLTTIICLNCSKQFNAFRWRHRKFCTKICAGIFNNIKS